MHIRKTTLLIPAFIFCSMLLLGQQAVVPAGGEASGEGGTVSWSVGQVACHEWTSSMGQTTEGVQQPYEILLNDVPELENDSICLVYPNPTTGKVTVRFYDNSHKDGSYCLYDPEGVLLRKSVNDGNEFSISFDNLQPSVYYLVILENSRPVKTCKIIKQ
jgi:hypothetical protein